MEAELPGGRLPTGEQVRRGGGGGGGGGGGAHLERTARLAIVVIPVTTWSPCRGRRGNGVCGVPEWWVWHGRREAPPPSLQLVQLGLFFPC